MTPSPQGQPSQSQTTANEALTEQGRIKLLAGLLLSEPWMLVACGLGDVTGGDLAKQLLALRKPT